jgi:GLPGLI family protein
LKTKNKKQKTKIIIIYAYFLLSTNSYGQKQIYTGEINYEVNMLVNESKLDSIVKKMEGSENMKKMIIFNMKNQKGNNFKLKFNKNESIFEEEKRLKINEKKINFTRIMMGNGSYYTNKKTKEILNQKETYGQLFIVDVSQVKWELTQERKKIDSYVCYKATTFKKVENSEGKNKVEVIAWYTTELPYNFGPNEFSGLPGLILELQEGNLIIKVSKINLINKYIEIKKPVRGKKITLQEFNILSKKMYDNRRN